MASVSYTYIFNGSSVNRILYAGEYKVWATITHENYEDFQLEEVIVTVNPWI